LTLKEYNTRRAPLISAQEIPILDLDSLIGAKVRAYRKARGLTQSQLAEACGVSFQQVQKYERGVNRVSASMLIRISEYLKIPVIDFLPDHAVGADPAVETAFVKFQAVRGSLEIAEIYTSLPPPKRQLLAALARSMCADEPAGDN
jgi:transcriptional regulator with XRE-family HTH domain